jgi:hypothetical protein
MAQKKYLKNLGLIKPLTKWLKRKEIDDIIVFGSILKGKKDVNDIDVAVVFKEFSEKLWKDINKIGDKYHFSKIKFSQFLEEPSFWQTLIHEGYSLKYNEMISNIIGMKSFFLFEYKFGDLDRVKQQTFSHALYGSGGRESFLKSIDGEKLGNKRVIVPFDSSEEMRSFFDTWNLVYTVRRIWL